VTEKVRDVLSNAQHSRESHRRQAGAMRKRVTGLHDDGCAAQMMRGTCVSTEVCSQQKGSSQPFAGIVPLAKSAALRAMITCVRCAQLSMWLTTRVVRTLVDARYSTHIQSRVVIRCAVTQINQKEQMKNGGNRKCARRTFQ
jgi:hypothetical protein